MKTTTTANIVTRANTLPSGRVITRIYRVDEFLSQ